MVDRKTLIATVYSHNQSNTEWAVECILNDADGNVDKAIFMGPDAKEQAYLWVDTQYSYYFTPNQRLI